MVITLNSTRFQCWNNDYSILNMWLKYVFTLKSTWIQLQLLVEIMLIKHWINIDSTLKINVESTFGFQRWYKFSKSNIISTLNQHRKPTLNQCWVPARILQHCVLVYNSICKYYNKFSDEHPIRWIIFGYGEIHK